MSTKLAIEGRLMRLRKEAQKLGHHSNANEAAEAALSEYVIKHKQLKILDLFGTIDFDKNYDYKRA